MPELIITYRDPADLKPDPGNARIHPKKQIVQLVASIRSVGFVNPILIDEDDAIIAGHGRLIAAKEVGLSSVPTIRLEGLSDLDKRKLRIADNRIAQNAAWDLDLLKVELQEIRRIQIDFKFNEIGIPTGEADKILFSTKVTVGEESVAPPPSNPVSRRGDIWILGGGAHRVGCGDTRDLEFLRAVCGPEPMDASHDDVPYNLSADKIVARGRHREFLQAFGELTTEEFRQFLRVCLTNCAAVSRDGAVHFLWIDHRHFEDLSAACDGIYAERLNVCIWKKSNAGMGSLYRSQHEMIFVMKVGKAPHINNVELGKHGRNRSNIWEYESVNTPRAGRRSDLDLHPTVKPVGLVADAILDVTRPNDLVLDAFLGSGGALLACVRTGRRCRGVEIDPGYVDLAVTRWMNLTGQQAIHEGTGLTFEALKRNRLADPEAG